MVIDMATVNLELNKDLFLCVAVNELVLATTTLVTGNSDVYKHGVLCQDKILNQMTDSS